MALGVAWWHGVQQRPMMEARGLDVQRPVKLVGRVSGHGVCEASGCRIRFRVEGWDQGMGPVEASFPVWVAFPTGSDPPILGTGLRLKGYLRRRGADGNEPSSRPGAWRLTLKSARFLEVSDEPLRLWRWVHGLRQGLLRALGKLSSRDASPGRILARALLLGDRSALPKAWSQALRRSGLAHLLAVSGLHVAVVSLWVFLPGSPLSLRWRCVLACLLVVAYVLLLGPRPSVLRALAMAALAFLALSLERPPQALNALCCGGMFLVLWEPTMVEDLGFQLSAVATLGVLVLMPRLEARWRSWPAALRRPLAASVAAQVSTLPILWTLEGGIHPLAAPLNLLALPWLALFLGTCWLWMASVWVWPALAKVLLALLDVLGMPVVALADLPASQLFLWPLHPVPGLAWIPLGMVAVWILGPLEAFHWTRRVLSLFLFFLAVGLGVRGKESVGVEFAMLDVGQGDAFVLRDGERAILVDGGGWPAGDLGGRRLVPVLVAAGIRRLDAVVLTHPDLDHCGGLVDVARYLVVEEVWTTPGAQREVCGRELLAAPGPRWRPLFKGQVRHLGRLRLEVLHPGPKEAWDTGNEGSLVMRAEAFGYRLLLTGDIGSATESLLRRRDPERLRADVLKVAHHGSRSSTSRSFLRAVSPRWALVSAGRRNPYGHPSKDVLSRLQDQRIPILRTDRHGMVRLRFSAGGGRVWETLGEPRAGEP